MEKRRPTGILIIAILMILIGIGSIILGLSTLSLGWLLDASSSQDLPGGLVPGIIASGAFTLALGIATLVISWGLLKAKGWAWLLTVIIAIISIINSLAAIFVGSIAHVVLLIIYGAILYYLYRPEVKSYFGRAQIP